jgi:hypothetical protein
MLDFAAHTPDVVLAALFNQGEPIARRCGTDHAAVLTNFTRAILFDEPLLAPAAEGISAVRLSNAILLSAWLEREVSFDFDDALFGRGQPADGSRGTLSPCDLTYLRWRSAVADT